MESKRKDTNCFWDGMNRLLEKIKFISEEQDWPELMTMVMTQVFDGVDTVSDEDKFFDHEQFLMRLCIRYKTFKKSEFNIVHIDDKNERFAIKNYDFKTFLWGKKLVPEYIDNNVIYVPFEKLNEKQKEVFKRKAVNNYETTK